MLRIDLFLATLCRRRLSLRTSLVLGGMVIAPAGIATVLACGPFFPEQLLDHREQTLTTLPDFSFDKAAATLVAASPKPRSAAQPVPSHPVMASDRAKTLYAQGATAYHDPASPDRGAGFFRAVLALPDAERADLTLRATYTLGEAERLLATGDGAEAHRLRAAQAFAETRRLVAGGLPDPDALAQASWGEEARLFLVNGQTDCQWTDFLQNSVCAAGLTPEQTIRAIHLYAHQAADGGASGLDSLSLLADWVLGDKARTAALLHDPVVRHLLLARLQVAPDWIGKMPPGMEALVAFLEANGPQPGDSVDRLAAFAYRRGAYDLAGHLAAQEPSPLAAWVRAKLAVRSGDIQAAARAYGQATQGFPVLKGLADPETTIRLRGEEGVLALARGEFVQAFGILFSAAQDAGTDSGIASDASYVAERVLTTQELRAFVDAYIPASPAPAVIAGTESYPMPYGERVRIILARRLVRDGEVLASVPYFPADNDPRFGSWTPAKGLVSGISYRTQVRAYDAALVQAHSAWSRVDRAKGWFEAATILNSNGMDIMGTEQDPDYAFVDGFYGSGAGRDVYQSVKNDLVLPPTAKARAAVAVTGPFTTAEERLRFASSEAKPYKRFHYRALAVEDAVRAADMLPSHSQAFAAVLCQAAGWGTDRRSALYARYVRQGAYVPFGSRFGKTCEIQPDFEAARFYTTRQVWGRAARHVRAHIGLVVFALVSVTGAGVVGLFMLRHPRRKR